MRLSEIDALTDEQCLQMFDDMQTQANKQLTVEEAIERVQQLVKGLDPYERLELLREFAGG